MKRYFYYVFSNKVPCGGGTLTKAERLAKQIRRVDPSYNVTVEKTPLVKCKGGWK